VTFFPGPDRSPPQHAGELADLVERARRLSTAGERRILGLVGPPGSGKSTFAAALVERLAPGAVLVSMDGFHLADRVLRRLGRWDRKGAEDTFDASGFVALLRRLHDPEETLVYAPEFRREIEEPIACAVPVPREVPLVVVEGNYLLLDRGAWRHIRRLLDEAWYLDADEGVRLERLIARHVAHGKLPDAARAWALGTDQRNAELVAGTRRHADLAVRVDEVLVAVPPAGGSRRSMR
jgi:pantothenate kinase